MAYSQQYLHKTKRLDPEIMAKLADPKSCGFDRRTAAGKRDWLMVSVMRQTGMRCVEIRRLTAGNLDAQADGTLLVRFSGKGKRERLAIIRNGVAAELKRYVKARRIRADQPVFPALDSHANPTDKPVSTVAIYHVVAKVGRRLGVKLHPHQIRHTWISETIDAGVPLGQAMALAGHSNLATTQRYYHQSPKRMAEAYGSLPDFMG